MRRRIEALNDLDALLHDGQPIAPALLQRAKAICAELESVNVRLYEAARQDIQRGAGKDTLLEWMPDWDSATDLVNRGGYDHLDELVSGVLQFDEPSTEVIRLASEMVPYQPTPVRHIFDLIRRISLTERDVLIDLGSGLGHVTLMASICTSATCTGIELEPSYVECARKGARSVNLNTVTFIQGDAVRWIFPKVPFSICIRLLPAPSCKMSRTRCGRKPLNERFISRHSARARQWWPNSSG